MKDVPELTDAEAAVLRCWLLPDDGQREYAVRSTLDRELRSPGSGVVTPNGRRALAAYDAKKRAEIVDPIYQERDRLVAALSKVYPSKLARHPEHETWDDDWRWITFVELPTGQASWHIHDSEVKLFTHLLWVGAEWDGHTTEEKYRRVDALPSEQRSAIRVEAMRECEEIARDNSGMEDGAIHAANDIREKIAKEQTNGQS